MFEGQLAKVGLYFLYKVVCSKILIALAFSHNFKRFLIHIGIKKLCGIMNFFF